jgi:uncharacterized protein YecE (DUF72 family)
MVYTDIPHELHGLGLRLGIAGWSIRREHIERFGRSGTHLQRYATRFNAVEINSCFYRPHRLTTYERWSASVPDDFRFAVKLPKSITHEARLVNASALLDQFLYEISGLGAKLGPILVQLPPSFGFDRQLVATFLTELRQRFTKPVVWEPRHETWFDGEADALLADHRIARVAADPARVPAAAMPAGFPGVVYYRLHGSPRVYYSKYDPSYLQHTARTLLHSAHSGAEVWCIFDNTALGAATSDAFEVEALLLCETGR